MVTDSPEDFGFASHVSSVSGAVSPFVSCNTYSEASV